MNATIIASTSIFALSGFLLLRRAAHWNADTRERITRVITVIHPILLCSALCAMFYIYPLPVGMGVIGCAILYITLAQKGIIKEPSWNLAGHMLITGTVAVVFVAEGVLASAAPRNVLSNEPDLCYAIGTTRAAALLTSELRYTVEQKYASVHIRAGSLLRDMRDLRSTPSLIAALKDEDTTVRFIALKTLGKRHDTRATGALIGLLDDWMPTNPQITASGPVVLDLSSGSVAAANTERYRIRDFAAAALGEIGDKHAIPALKEADRKYHFGAGCAFCAALHNLGAR